MNQISNKYWFPTIRKAIASVKRNGTNESMEWTVDCCRASVLIPTNAMDEMKTNYRNTTQPIHSSLIGCHCPTPRLPSPLQSIHPAHTIRALSAYDFIVYAPRRMPHYLNDQITIHFASIHGSIFPHHSFCLPSFLLRFSAALSPLLSRTKLDALLLLSSIHKNAITCMPFEFMSARLFKWPVCECVVLCVIRVMCMHGIKWPRRLPFTSDSSTASIYGKLRCSCTTRTIASAKLESFRTC